MVAPSRYDVSAETAGIQGELLKNKLGITDQKLLQDIESVLLKDTYTHFLELLQKRELKFTLVLLFEIHNYFLNTVYEWAGENRTVDISKDNILFVPASHLTTALKELETIIHRHIPKPSDTKRKIAEKLAVIHCEFNAIHPFREGNGRTIRLFLDLLALEHGYEFINYKKSSQPGYIKACIAGMKKEYIPMTKIMYRGLSKNPQR